jgi:ankyrin repeat protein
MENVLIEENAETTRLHFLCGNNFPQLEEIKIHLNKSTINKTDKNGDTALHIACSNPNISTEIVKLLIDNGADFKIKNEESLTPFHNALNNSKLKNFLKDNLNSKFFQTFLEKEKIDIEILENLFEIYNFSASIFFAIQNKYISLDIVEYFKKKQFPLIVKNQNHQFTLDMALQNKNISLEIIKFLFENKSNLNNLDSDEKTPLHYACSNENISLEILMFLVEKKANLNSKNETPFDFVCTNNKSSVNILKFMLEKKASCNSEIFGNPLVIICNSEKISLEKVKLFKDLIKLNDVDETSLTSFHYACMNASNDIIQYMVEENANLNSTSKFGNTPLHYAFLNNKLSTDTLCLLISKKANINEKNKIGESALYEYCRTRDFQDAKNFLENFQDANSRNIVKETLLHVACSNNTISIDVIKLFLQNKAKLNLEDKKGITPLHYAFSNQNITEELLMFMINEKADLKKKDDLGNSMLHYADWSKIYTENFLNFLFEKKADIKTTNKENKIAFDPGEVALENLKIFLKKERQLDFFEFIRKKILISGNFDGELIGKLFDKKFGINARLGNQLTTLHFACQKKDNFEKIKLLLDMKAKPIIRTNEKRKSALDLLIENKNHSESVINLFLLNKADLNSVDKNYNTALGNAIENNIIDAKILRLLVNETNVNMKNKKGEWPIQKIIKKNPHPLELLKLMIEKKAKLDLKSDKGDSLLKFAIKYRELEVIKYLVENGASGNAISKKFNAFHLIARKKNFNYDTFNFFIHKNLEVNYKCKDGMTPLIHYFLLHKNIELEVIKYLVENKALLNSTENSPFLLACSKKNLSQEMLEYLISQNSNVNVKDKQDNTALHFLCKNEKCSLEMLKYLISQNSNVNAKDKQDNTALHFLCKNENCSPEMLDYLISQNSNVNAKDKQDNTALHFLCKNEKCSLEMLEYLISQNSNVNAKDKQDNTALHFLCKNENCSPEMLEYLISQNSNVNAKDKQGNTAFHFICKNENIENFIFLWENYSGFDSINKSGEIPLEFILRNKNISIELIDRILKKKRIDSFYSNQKTIFHYICMNPLVKKEILISLIDKKANLNMVGEKHSYLKQTKTSPFHFACKFLPMNLLDLFFVSADKQIFSEKRFTFFHHLCSNLNITVEILKEFKFTPIYTKIFRDHKILSGLICSSPTLPVYKVYNKFGELPLHVICRNPKVNIDMVTLLIDSYECTKIEHKSPLYYACINPKISLEIIKYLLINLKGLDLTFILHSVFKIEGISEKILQLLLPYVKNMKTIDKKKRTALHIICENQKISFKSLKLLIDYSADPHALDKDDLTPMHYLKENEQKKILQYYQYYKKKINQKN